ncbi:hypothetical protein JCM10212_002399 [Sporobolomyces blumeae]
MTSVALPPLAPHSLQSSHASAPSTMAVKPSQLAADRPVAPRLEGTTYEALAGSKPLTLASLLENPVEFVKQTRVTRDDDIPYKPINQKSAAPLTSNGSTPLASTSKHALSTPPSSSSSVAPPVPLPPSSSSKSKALFPSIDPSPTWARPYPVGSGFQNVGNTCFLNSALQCLLHTAPLVRYLETQGPGAHPSEQNCLTYQKKKFCMTCAMRSLVKQSFAPQRKRSYTPMNVVKNMKAIAKHLRHGRQEDSHEFLRFVVDAMQLSSLAGKNPKLTPQEKNQNPIHQLFGGLLRSRVHCTSCQHNSDTIDAMLDLSLDLSNRAESVKDGLDNLVKVDHLKGQNKYRCEKCKKLVNAEKQFTIERAPLVLTIHLKRFTPTGRKVSGTIRYPEKLSLGNYMSDGSQNPTYVLNGIILHSGSGVHSGHYRALVRAGRDSKFYEMDDETVSPVHGVPLRSPHAYVLFYVRERGDQLKEVLGGNGGADGLGGPGKKRKRESVGNGNGDGNGPRKSVGGGAGGGGDDDVGSEVGERATPVSNGSKTPRRSETTASPTAAAAREGGVVRGPQPPQIVTASTPASPKLSNASPSAFSTTTSEKRESAGSFTEMAQEKLLARIEASRAKKLHLQQKEYQSRNAPGKLNAHGPGHGQGRGVLAKSKKLAHRLQGKNRPKMLK